MNVLFQQEKGLTEKLNAFCNGNIEVFEQIYPLIYPELHRIARRCFKAERANHTLQPTELLNEIFLKFIKENKLTLQNRTHFLGRTAKMMRHFLINYAIEKRRKKRGEGAVEVPLEQAFEVAEKSKEKELIDLDEALRNLEKFDLRRAQIVELRYFGGLTIEETAEYLKISIASVKREWSTARLWLKKQIISSN